MSMKHVEPLAFVLLLMATWLRSILISENRQSHGQRMFGPTVCHGI
jgi:hypothetical protein